jgi:hypothetical protein
MLMVSVIAAIAAAPVAELPKSSAPTCGVTIEKVELFRISLVAGQERSLPTPENCPRPNEASKARRCCSPIAPNRPNPKGADG